MNDPYYKATLQHCALGAALRMLVPHDVFSTQRIDEGTLLLLENLPTRNPATVLDIGCGYGALGLPIAAKYKYASVEMIDRDLLAVEWTEKNAKENQLNNVIAYGSLGFRAVLPRNICYDWIVCNVPARIGTPFIEDIFLTGNSLLSDDGEILVVVIRDLGPVIEELKLKHTWKLEETARGPRHIVYRLKKYVSEKTVRDSKTLYLRDQIQVDSLSLSRPFDFGGDDQKRLRSGLPVLIDTLPRADTQQKIKSVFCFRAGYGAIPLLALKRWPHAKVTAVDRDLLATTFLRLNSKLANEDEKIDVREASRMGLAIHPGEKFSLVLGELSPSADRDVALDELSLIETILDHGAEALILCLEKIERDWIKLFASRSKLAIYKVLSREGYTVIRLSKSFHSR